MKKKLYIAILLCLSAVAAQAEWTVATVPNPRVTDAYAYVANPDGEISSACVEKLTTISQTLYEATGVELVTVVLNSIGYEDAFDFSLDLFNTWGIGDAEKNRGVLIFMAMEYHDIRIVTGGGVEGLLPDATCSDIIWGDMVPEFRAGDIDKGVLEGAMAIYEHLTTDEAQAELLLDFHKQPVSESPFKGLSIVSLIILILTLLGHWVQPRCPNCKKKGSTKKDEIIHNATYAAAGEGVHHYTCNHCGHKWDKHYTIAKLVPYSSSSSSTRRYSSGGYGSRGGGSFGGGRSFGGGAGGRW